MRKIFIFILIYTITFTSECFAKSSLEGYANLDDFYANQKIPVINYLNTSPINLKHQMLINITDCDLYFTRNPNAINTDVCSLNNIQETINTKLNLTLFSQQKVNIPINSSCCLNSIVCHSRGTISGTSFKIDVALASSNIGIKTCITELNYNID